MAKVRVYQLAKELGLDSRELLAMVKDMGEYAKSASSTLNMHVVRKVRERVAGQLPPEQPRWSLTSTGRS